MQRRQFLQGVAGLAASSWLGAGCQFLESPARRPTRRPNLVFIMADDLGYADLSCYGSTRVHTPHLDALAAGGLKATSFYAGSAVCTPTRVSCLTGRAPLRFNATSHFHLNRDDRYLPAGPIRLGKLLQQAGYRTIHVGKWHVGGTGAEETAARRRRDGDARPGPHEQGFDHYYSGVEDDIWMEMARTEMLYRQGGTRMLRNDEMAPPCDGWFTNCLVDEALTEIERSHRQGRPFFLNLWFINPHTPYEPAPEPHLGRYQARGAIGDDLEFRSMVSNMDENVGRVLAKLRQLGLERDTLIVFTSDNGPSVQGDCQPLRGGKADLHEGGIRVPMIASWPGHIPAGQVSWAAMHTNDILPTFCAAAGTTVPQPPKIDGINLLGHWRGGDAPADRGMLFWQLDLYMWYPQPGDKPEPYATEAVRWGKWKLLARDGQPTELFDLVADVRERHNLLDKQPDIAAPMTAALRRWLREPRIGPYRPLS